MSLDANNITNKARVPMVRMEYKSFFVAKRVRLKLVFQPWVGRAERIKSDYGSWCGVAERASNLEVAVSHAVGQA